MVNNSNKPDAIIIHCSATREGQDIGVKEIDSTHKQRGFNKIGYHYVIRLDGSVEKGREETAIGAHCNTKGFSRQSYNRHSIGICYVGGLDKNICRRYPIVELLGHRDTSPDLNDNGEVEPAEYIKACPCFDVRSEYGLLKKDVIITP